MAFELNVPDWYTPKAALENDFINAKQSPADLAKYGKTYSVAFEGDAETYLWTTKTPPEEGKKYWGHIQETSGKMLRFKVDKKEDMSATPLSPSTTSGNDNKYLKDVTDLYDRWLARLVPYFNAQKLIDDNGKPNEEFRHLCETAQAFTDEASRGIEFARNNGSSGEVSTPSPTIKESRPSEGSAVGYDKFKQAKANFQKAEPEDWTQGLEEPA